MGLSPQARADNDWQRQMRDQFLEPWYQERTGGRFVFIEDDDPEPRPLSFTLQKMSIDTIARGTQGGFVAVEEKIVRWPRDKKTGELKPYGYDAFSLEEWSTPPNHPGWMRTAQSDALLWCFANRDDTGLDCYWIPFQPLIHWFWTDIERFHQSPVGGCPSLVRLVKCADVMAEIPNTLRFTLP